MSNIFSRKTNNNDVPQSAPLFRRLAAMVYDSFIVFSFLLLVTSIALLANKGGSLLPYKPYFLTYLILSTGLFLSWFWHRGGQTLGMLAWKIKVIDASGEPLRWPKALWRYFIAIPSITLGGLGLFWCLIDKDRQSLHDRLAGTKMVKTVPKNNP